MALDPRTPVVVGVGQVTSHQGPDAAPEDRPEPLDLMVAALERAAEDCDGVGVGRPASVGRRVLARMDSLRVVASMGWRPPDPALAVAGRLGIDPPDRVVSATGGNMPQSLLHDAARSISRGELDVVAVTGAECFHSRAAIRRAGGWAEWTEQDPATPPARLFGSDRAPATAAETACGMQLPVHAYPLLENAWRMANGWSLEEHRTRVGAVWSRFSEVASANPYAWLPESLAAAEITTPTTTNRMVAFPYPKLAVANIAVDQGAAYLVCSVAAARASGVPEERWVFPLAGAEANDHWFLSDRPALGSSPPIRLAGRTALELAGVGVDDLMAVDLYSCFPVVVQVAAHELGLDPLDPARPLTLTGGLTFGGGPGNNYTTHGIASLVTRLRTEPGSVGMASGLGWYSTKHAIGVYGARPPEHAGAEPFRLADAQAQVDATPICRRDDHALGSVRIETYTVVHGRDGCPEHGIVVCRTAAGHRTWATISDHEELVALEEREGGGRGGIITADRVLHLS